MSATVDTPGKQVTNATPALSVIMPVYNGAPYLRQAIDSILGQTYRRFELIVIDDASSDDSFAIARQYRDPRIRLFRHPTNRGLVQTINMGLQNARARYVTRTDQDDVSYPSRFGTQLAYLERYPAIVVLGTQGDFIDGTGTSFAQYVVPTAADEIRRELPRRNCFISASVIFDRRLAIEVGAFRPEALYAEDYDLWLRMAERGDIANLPDVLVGYRIHANQLTGRRLEQQWQAARQASAEARLATRNGASAPDRASSNDRALLASAYLHWMQLATSAGLPSGVRRRLLWRAFLLQPFAPAVWTAVRTVVRRPTARFRSIASWYAGRLRRMVRRSSGLGGS